MQFMIVERFKEGKIAELYHRFDEKGRMLPNGVDYISSWINEEVTLCYQLMEAASLEKITEWTKHWNDLADFEIIPVISSADAKKKVLGIN